jgi:hypothetical protein
MAQRLAKMALMRARQAITVALPCKPRCMNVAVGDVVSLSLDALGWHLKPFRVMGWGMTPEMGVDLQLQEDAPSSYAWDANDAIDDAPDSSLSLLGSMAAPENLQVQSTSAIQPDGTTLSSAQLSWSAIGSALIAGYEVHYQLSDASTWQIAQTSGHAITLSGVFLASSTYRFKVRGLFGHGARQRPGPFSALVAAVIAKDLTPPQAPTALSDGAIHPMPTYLPSMCMSQPVMIVPVPYRSLGLRPIRSHGRGCQPVRRATTGFGPLMIRAMSDPGHKAPGWVQRHCLRLLMEKMV